MDIGANLHNTPCLANDKLEAELFCIQFVQTGSRIVLHTVCTNWKPNYNA
jgi:hypothetical protein